MRLESIAPAGGICVSAAIYEQILGKLTLGAEIMGEQHVKNIPRPIHAYRLTPGDSERTAQAPQSTHKRPSRLVIAAGAVACVAARAVVGVWLMYQRTETEPVPVQAATPAVPSPAAAVDPNRPLPAQRPASTPPMCRPSETFAGVNSRITRAPRTPRRWRSMYAASFVAMRSIDFAARRIAMEECNKAVQREVPAIREFDRCITYAVGNDVVWSYRFPPLPRPPYVPATRPLPPIRLDPAAIPLIGEAGRKNVADHYLKSDRKRALVLGRNHFDWWSPSKTEADAIKRTLQTCGHITGRPCVVYAVEEQVLVRTPQRHRPVAVFTPRDFAGRDASQQDAVEHYLVADDWRAIAVGRNGRIGIAIGRASEAAATDAAIRACAQAGGTECALSAVGPFLVAPNQLSRPAPCRSAWPSPRA